jgi:acetoacetate decarboxylase
VPTTPTGAADIHGAEIRYPPPPWKLHGQAACVFGLVPVTKAQAFVPSDISIVRVQSGRALAAIYAASYEAGSTLRYRELIVIPALVRHGWRIGAWISHIYVDDPRSVAGGRAIWGLPKEMAAFTLDEAAGTVCVHQGSQRLCTLRAGGTRALLRLPVLLPALSPLRRLQRLLWFAGTGTTRVAIRRVELDIPEQSPLYPLGLTSGRGIVMSDMRLVVHAPRSGYAS